MKKLITKILNYFGYYKEYSWSFWTKHKDEWLFITVGRGMVDVKDGNTKQLPFSDIARWDRGLTQKEAKLIYNNGIPPDIARFKPEHWWSMVDDNIQDIDLSQFDGYEERNL